MHYVFRVQIELMNNSLDRCFSFISSTLSLVSQPDKEALKDIHKLLNFTLNSKTRLRSFPLLAILKPAHKHCIRQVVHMY